MENEGGKIAKIEPSRFIGTDWTNANRQSQKSVAPSRYSVSRLHEVQKQINPKNQLKGTIQKGVECV